MTKLSEEFISRALKAIRDSKSWQRVLQSAVDVSGATAATITLRDKKNCQIVNDIALENEYHSPLICGFPLEGVIYYLEKLRTIDPWAEAQRQHYPFQPTLMSEICNPNEVEDRRFFDWLNKQGIYDTITFELDRMPDHWTACNLFLSEQGHEGNSRALNFANTHYKIFRDAWQSSQEMVHSRQSRQVALHQLANLNIPACITTTNHAVIAYNKLFSQLVDEDVIKVLGKLKTLSLCRSVKILSGIGWLYQKVPRHNGACVQYNMNATPFDSDPLYPGKKGEIWLLTFQKESEPFVSSQKYDLTKLTRQEKRLFEAIRNGLKIEDAGKSIGYARTRTYEIWDCVKEKLSITNAHQIRH